MDYQGNYFKEEHDERESKTYRVVKGIFKWTMYAISFLIYGIIFYMIFANRDSKILKNMYFTDEAIQQAAEMGDAYNVYQVNPKEFMNGNGTFQIYNVYYAEDSNLLEIGIKFNKKKLCENDASKMTVTLKDSEGNVYTPVNILKDEHGKYGFLRICYGNINLNLSQNDLKFKPDGEHKTGDRKDIKYTLQAFSPCKYYNETKEKEEPEYKENFKIYDNSTVFTRTDFDAKEAKSK